MVVDTLLFVSKRASAVVAAVLCLAVAHLAVQTPGARLASASEVRVAIDR